MNLAKRGNMYNTAAVYPTIHTTHRMLSCYWDSCACLWEEVGALNASLERHCAATFFMTVFREAIQHVNSPPRDSCLSLSCSYQAQLTETSCDLSSQMQATESSQSPGDLYLLFLNAWYGLLTQLLNQINPKDLANIPSGRPGPKLQRDN